MSNSGYFSQVELLMPQSLSEIDKIIDSLLECINSEGTIWIIGNGGSASTADHFEVDLSYVRLTHDPVTLKARSLCANSALLTAIGNDIGFAKIYSHQLLRNAGPGDVCFAVSASGNSPNLIEAFKVCTEKSVKKIALLGFDGGELLHLADESVLVQSEGGLFGPVEDIHLSICHFIASAIKNRLFETAK
jgi:D-sedoheptulose 7-phosphate isomerase